MRGGGTYDRPLLCGGQRRYPGGCVVLRGQGGGRGAVRVGAGRACPQPPAPSCRQYHQVIRWLL
eukprot:6912949-Pyramimonas_sp.AAC.1